MRQATYEGIDTFRRRIDGTFDENRVVVAHRDYCREIRRRKQLGGYQLDRQTLAYTLPQTPYEYRGHSHFVVDRTGALQIWALA